MGSATTFTASGQGTLALGSFLTIQEVGAGIVTPADLARLYGTSPVRRVFNQCSFGLGWTAGVGTPFDGTFLTTWWRYLYLEAEFHILSHQPNFADVLWWDIAPGGVMAFEVNW